MEGIAHSFGRSASGMAKEFAHGTINVGLVRLKIMEILAENSFVLKPSCSWRTVVIEGCATVCTDRYSCKLPKSRYTPGVQVPR